MSDLEQWEAEADEFFRDTGFMRPGKDDVRGIYYESDREVAFAVWRKLKAKFNRESVSDAQQVAPASAGGSPALLTVVVPRALLLEAATRLELYATKSNVELLTDATGTCIDHLRSLARTDEGV